MKNAELVAAVVAANPQLFRDMPEMRARRIVNAVIRQIGVRIDQQAGEGRVNMPGLGVFVVRHVAPREGAAPVRRVVLRRVKPAPGQKPAPTQKPLTTK